MERPTNPGVVNLDSYSVPSTHTRHIPQDVNCIPVPGGQYSFVFSLPDRPDQGTFFPAEELIDALTHLLGATKSAVKSKEAELMQRRIDLLVEHGGMNAEKARAVYQAMAKAEQDVNDIQMRIGDELIRQGISAEQAYDTATKVADEL